VRAPYRFGHPRPTHCLHGHEYTPENTRIVVNNTGREQRRCVICRKAASRASYLRHQAERREYSRLHSRAYYVANADDRRAWQRAYSARKRAEKAVGATAVMDNLNPLPCGRSTDA
jgi:hypothetical protein